MIQAARRKRPPRKGVRLSVRATMQPVLVEKKEARSSLR